MNDDIFNRTWSLLTDAYLQRVVSPKRADWLWVGGFCVSKLFAIEWVLSQATAETAEQQQKIAEGLRWLPYNYTVFLLV
jgi:hypothetical protein